MGSTPKDAAIPLLVGGDNLNIFVKVIFALVFVLFDIVHISQTIPMHVISLLSGLITAKSDYVFCVSILYHIIACIARGYEQKTYKPPQNQKI